MEWLKKQATTLHGTSFQSQTIIINKLIIIKNTVLNLHYFYSSFQQENSQNFFHYWLFKKLLICLFFMTFWFWNSQSSVFAFHNGTVIFKSQLAKKKKILAPLAPWRVMQYGYIMVHSELQTQLCPMLHLKCSGILWETEIVNGLDISKIMGGLLPTLCKLQRNNC